MKHSYCCACLDVHRGRTGLRALAVNMLLPALAWAGVAVAQGPAYTVVVEPAEPQAQQATYAQVHLPDCRRVSEVSHDQGTLRIGILATGCFIPRPGVTTLSRAVSLGKLPQGEYRVRAVDAGDPARPALGPDLVITVAAPDPAAAPSEAGLLLDFSGWWTTADPTTGQGWLVEHKLPNRMMFSWVSYDDDGNPTWLVMQSTGFSPGQLSGPVYRAQRQGDEIVRTLVGEGRFSAASADQATFTLVPTGPAGDPITTELRRLAF